MIKNKSDVKKLSSDMNNIKLHMQRLSEEHFNKKIIEAWKNLKPIVAENNLKKMLIDTISTLEKGMPINALMTSGLRTIYDVKDFSIYDFRNLNGVGEITGYAIHDAVSKIKQSVYERAVPRINPDHVSVEDLQLLESIYSKWEILSRIVVLQPDVDRLEKSLNAVIKTALQQKGFIGSLFQSKSVKEEISDAIEILNRVSNRKEFEKVKREVIELIRFQVDRKTLIKHFVAKNAAYYTEIEKVLGLDQSDMTDALPTAIVDAVNEFPLNTTGLEIQLRNYQLFGARYALHFKRTLLGDEMGLGKTIQALALINHLYQNNQHYSIVVCPLSVLPNWKREIEQHSKLKTFTFHGNKRDAAFAKWQKEKGVLLTTYEHTLRMNFDDGQNIDALIVDEAHYVKNPDAKRSISTYNLASIADYVLFMSGTPLENRLEEMKQLISVLQSDVAEQLSQELNLLEPMAFKKTIGTVYLRRNRKEVLSELPELEIISQWMDFGKEEKQHYRNAVMAKKIMTMRRTAWLGGTPAKSPKLEKLLDICEEAYENGHKVLVFSFFRDVIRTIQEHLGERTGEAISGDVPNARRQEIIDEFTEDDDKSVLVSQITAGGVGLNIQAANIVILCEPQWKPSTEEQAISRAYRMGQSRNVVVYRLLTEDSIDVSMLEVLGHKADLFDLYARDSDVAALAMSEIKEADDKSMEQQVLKLEQERLEKEVS